MEQVLLKCFPISQDLRSRSRPHPSLKFDGSLVEGPVSRKNERHLTRRAIHPLWGSKNDPLP